MKLIDKEQAYQTLSEYYHHTGSLQHKALREALDRVPVVDAVSVIRCKDCKYYAGEGKGCDNDDAMIIATAEDFCSLAERKEE